MSNPELVSRAEEARLAPTIPEILDNPFEMERRENNVVFLARSPYAEGRLEDQKGQPYVVSATDEAQLLNDFNRRLSTLASTFSEVDPYLTSRAQTFRDELRYMGPKERGDASVTVAKNWQHQLRTGPDTLLVCIQQNRSSILVYQGIKAALDKLDPTAAERVRPVPEWGLARYIEQAKTSGIILVDDWAIIGSGLGKTIALLRDGGLPKDKLRVQLLSASTHVLENGIAGVSPETHFTFPFHLSNPGSALTSIVGAHGKPVLGFVQSMQLIYGCARQELRATRAAADEPTDNEIMPQLYSVFPMYDPWRIARLGRVEYRLSRKEHDILVEQRTNIETVARLAERALRGSDS